MGLVLHSTTPTPASHSWNWATTSLSPTAPGEDPEACVDSAYNRHCDLNWNPVNKLHYAKTKQFSQRREIKKPGDDKKLQSCWQLYWKLISLASVHAYSLSGLRTEFENLIFIGSLANRRNKKKTIYLANKPCYKWAQNEGVHGLPVVVGHSYVWHIVELRLPLVNSVRLATNVKQDHSGVSLHQPPPIHNLSHHIYWTFISTLYFTQRPSCTSLTLANLLKKWTLWLKKVNSHNTSVYVFNY